MSETDCDEGLVKRLAEIAKLELSDEEARKICVDIARIASYLRSVGEAVAGYDVEPLYHVWEEIGYLREPLEEPDRSIDVRRLSADVDERGYVRAPWRGGRIADHN
ncbi:MAG: aspartyl/glutamyl-tRNA amidotransferase subunit C [Acidilobaceae archaeon]